MNTNGKINRVLNQLEAESRSRRDPRVERIYRLLTELQDELNFFVPDNCNAAFAAAIMGTRQAIKALRVFF